MNGKKSKMLRRAAESATIGKPKSDTKLKYKEFKKTYRELKSMGFNANAKQLV